MNSGRVGELVSTLRTSLRRCRPACAKDIAGVQHEKRHERRPIALCREASITSTYQKRSNSCTTDSPNGTV